jgi:hypothetical protein
MSTIRANTITNAAGTGAPDFPNGATSGGVAVATTADIPTVNPFTLGTAVASTSGTAIDFTGIPSWAKRVTVMLNGVSLSGGASILIQAGVGSIQTTGYVSSSTYAGANSTFGVISSAGFVVYDTAAGNIIYANVQINLLTGSTWFSTHSGAIQFSTTPYLVSGGGNVTLGGTLDRVRITSTNGTDTFDAGTINISYEG